MTRKIKVAIGSWAVLGISAPACAVEVGQCLTMVAMNEKMRLEGQHSLFVGDWVDYDGQIVSMGDTSMTRAEWMRVSHDIQLDSQYRRDLVARLKAKGRTDAQVDAFMAKLRDVSAILANGDPNTPVPRHMMIFASNHDHTVGYIITGDRPSSEASSQACVKARLLDPKLAPTEVLNAQGPTEDLITARSDIVQTNGVKLSNISIALRGSIGSGDGRVVALQPGSPPLFILQSIKLRPAALEEAGR